MGYKPLLLVLLAGLAYGDTGFRDLIQMTETDGSPKCMAGQVKVQPGQLTCSGNTATLNITGGGGGASSLAVTVGVNRSSQTSDIMFNPAQFSGSISGSTITISSLGSTGGVSVYPATATIIATKGIESTTGTYTTEIKTPVISNVPNTSIAIGRLSSGSGTADAMTLSTNYPNATIWQAYTNLSIREYATGYSQFNSGAIGLGASKRGWTVKNGGTNVDTALTIDAGGNDRAEILNFQSSNASDANGGNIWYYPNQQMMGIDRPLNLYSTLVIGSTNTINSGKFTAPQSTQLQIISSDTYTYSVRIATWTEGTDFTISSGGVVGIKSLGASLGVCTDGSSQLTTSGCSFGGGGSGSGTVNAASQFSLPYYSLAGSSNVLSAFPGVTASTNTGVTISTLTVTSTATVAYLQFSGAGNYKFTNPGDSTIYQVVGSSTNATVGKCARFSSSWTITEVDCGSGVAGAGDNLGNHVTTMTLTANYGVVASTVSASTMTLTGQIVFKDGSVMYSTSTFAGTGDAVLAGTQTWTGGNALYGSTTFYGEVYMVGKSTVSYTEVFIDASTATFSGPVSLTTASVSGSLYFPTGTTQYTTPEIYVLNADSTTSNLAGGVVYASSSPIMTNVISGATVYFDCFIVFQTTATANGIMLAMWTKGTSGEIINYTANIPTAADGTGGALQGWGTSNGDRITGTGVQAANTSYIARLFGYHLPKANGTLGVLFSGETIRSSATLKAGSMCEWKKGYR